MDETSTAITALISARSDELDSSLVQFARSVTELNAFTVNLNEIMADLRAGRGTAGKLLSDDELYARFLALTQNLEQLSEDLKNNIGRYLSGADINLINLFDR